MKSYGIHRRGVLPLLALCCGLFVSSGRGWAGFLPGRPSDLPSVVGAPRIVYDASPRNVGRDDDVRRAGVGALALILVVPAGTQATNTPQAPASFLSNNNDGNTTQQNNGTPPGDGHISGGPPPQTNTTPEPGTLTLALAGCGTAVLSCLRRRRKDVSG